MNDPSDPSQDAIPFAVGQADDIDRVFAGHLAAAKSPDAQRKVRLNHGLALWRTYEFVRGTTIFEGLLEDQHTDVASLQTIAKCYFQSGKYRDAVRAMRAAAAGAVVDDCETVELLAGALERDNQLQAARSEAERALAICPASSRTTRLLAHIEKREGKYDAAVSRLHTHLQKYPSGEDWRLQYELASSLDRLGQYDAAWKHLEIAKAQLAPQTQRHLKDSYFIRRRQWEIARALTDADLARWRRTGEQQQSSQRLALLAGFPRSGTTLLEQMLACHPACLATDETGVLSAEFTSPMMWQAESADDALIELRSLDAEQVTAGRETYFRLTEACIGEPVGGRLLVEKDPLLTPDLVLPLRLFPEAKLLMPLRDPRDVVVSYFFTMVPLNWNSAPSTSILETCRFYFDCMRHWLLLRDRLPWSRYEIRYEDIVAKPTDTMQSLTKFLDVKWDDSLLDERLRSERRAARTPTYDDITKPIYARAVGRWKNYEKQLQPCLETLEPFLKAFGYENG